MHASEANRGLVNDARVMLRSTYCEYKMLGDQLTDRQNLEDINLLIIYM